jgi:hypothetical protein
LPCGGLFFFTINPGPAESDSGFTGETVQSEAVSLFLDKTVPLFDKIVEHGIIELNLKDSGRRAVFCSVTVPGEQPEITP